MAAQQAGRLVRRARVQRHRDQLHVPEVLGLRLLIHRKGEFRQGVVRLPLGINCPVALFARRDFGLDRPVALVAPLLLGLDGAVALDAGGLLGLGAAPRQHPADRRRHQRQTDERADPLHHRPVAPVELAQPVSQRRRARLHRVAGQVALHVAGQPAGRVVAAGAVLLQGLHHDPVEFAPQQLGELAGSVAPRAAMLAFVSELLSRVLGRGGSSSRTRRRISSRAARFNRSLLDRRAAGEQLVQQHAEGIHVGPRVHVQGVERRLFGGHVLPACRRSPEAGVDRSSR